MLRGNAEAPQRPRRRRCGAGSGRRKGHLPSGMALRPAQRRRHRCGPLRRTPDPSPARHVRQKPHLQNRRRRRLRLRRDPAAHRSRQNRHHAADHPPVSAGGYRGGLPGIRG